MKRWHILALAVGAVMALAALWIWRGAGLAIIGGLGGVGVALGRSRQQRAEHAAREAERAAAEAEAARVRAQQRTAEAEAAWADADRVDANASRQAERDARVRRLRESRDALAEMRRQMDREEGKS